MVTFRSKICLALTLTAAIALFISRAYFFNKTDSFHRHDDANSNEALNSGNDHVKEESKKRRFRIISWKTIPLFIILVMVLRKEDYVRIYVFLRKMRDSGLITLKSSVHTFWRMCKIMHKLLLPRKHSMLSNWLNQPPPRDANERNNPIKAYFTNRTFYLLAMTVPWIMLLWFMGSGFYMREKISRVEKVNLPLPIEVQPDDLTATPKPQLEKQSSISQFDLNSKDILVVALTWSLFYICKSIWAGCLRAMCSAKRRSCHHHATWRAQNKHGSPNATTVNDGESKK
uniref:Uncharacterized protein n=1 Tax=Trichuris muris TaxID=70415 RepID=A0A5S6R2Q2_TRIMR